MGGAHNLRLILQIEMQTDAIGVVDTRYTYMGMSCATPDKILHSTMQDNTKQLFQLPLVNTRFITSHYCIVQWWQTPQAGNLICAMIAGNGMMIHVGITLHYVTLCWHCDTWELLWVTLVYDRTLLSLGWSVSGSWLCRVTVILWHETFLLLPPCIKYM